MNFRFHHNSFIALSMILLLFVGTPAHAFRCGSKIVSKDMHEIQVRQACGEPTTMRYLGRTIRGVNIPIERRIAPGMTVRRYPGYGHFVQEVEVTEYVYNFGPRKLMRRLLFEGGILVSIETIGYGYTEKK